MERYVLVSFPEIQDFMEHPRWSECVFCQEIQGHPCPDSTYAVPEDLYCEVIWSSDKILNIIGKRFSFLEGDIYIECVVVGYEKFSNSGNVIVQRFDEKGWTCVDINDVILLPQSKPSYWYLFPHELIKHT